MIENKDDSSRKRKRPGSETELDEKEHEQFDDQERPRKAPRLSESTDVTQVSTDLSPLNLSELKTAIQTFVQSDMAVCVPCFRSLLCGC
jgi:hypothetical protein